MSINIHSVQLELQENGWTLLSTEYKNLKTLLSMQCPRGHSCEETYENWRKHKRCEKCLAADPFKTKNKIPIKTVEKYRILALDAATNLSGYAIYDDKELVGYGTYRAKGEDTTERINDVKHWVEAAIKEWQPEGVWVEDIQLQTYGNNQAQVKTYKSLAELQGVLFDTFYELKIPAFLVYSSEWRKVCGVGGEKRENKKKAAQDKVFQWYGLKCSQDEADAICIGKYGTMTTIKKSKWGENIKYD